MKGTIRLLAVIVPAVCAVVLLPTATNLATGLAPPRWLVDHRWVSWAGVGVFGTVSVLLAFREYREQLRRERERRDHERRLRATVRALSEPPETPGAQPPDPPRWSDLGDAVTVRVTALPEKVRGRDGDLSELTRERRRGRLVVLVGAGGTGKSTLARELVRRDGLADRPDRVWEVSAATSASLTAGLITVARLLGAGEPELEAIATGLPGGPDHLWRLLEDAPRGWVMIIDNADELEVLSRPAVRGADRARPVRDGTGWVRPTTRGLVLVTSRQRDPQLWPPEARLYPVPALSPQAAALVLLDHAPSAGGPEQAEALARRLGGLPLALHLAGRYLGSGYVGRARFDAYRRELDADPLAISRLHLDPDDPDTAERLTVLRTWELSLDALAEHGLAEARPLLRLLSCYAPAVPVPTGLLTPGPLEEFFRAASGGTGQPVARVDEVLRGLDRLGLVDRSTVARRPPETEEALVVHPVVADTNRVYLVRPSAADPPGSLVRHCAVRLLAADLGPLAADRPESWPGIRSSVSHLEALLANSAPWVDDQHLVTLIGTATHVAGAYAQMRSPETGIGLLRPALRQGQLRRLPSNPTLSLAWQRLASLWKTVGEPARAADVFQAILRSQGRWPDDDPANLALRHSLATCVAAQNRGAEAIEQFTGLLADERRVLGDEHPLTLATRSELLVARWLQGEQDALAGLRGLLADAERLPAGDADFALLVRHNLGVALLQDGQVEKARETLRQLVSDERRLLGEEHFLTVASSQQAGQAFLSISLLSTPELRDRLAIDLFEKGNSMADQERVAEAIATYRELIDRFGSDDTPLMRELVLKSLLNTANLQRRGGPGDRVRTYREVEERFGDEPDPALRKLTADALTDQARALFAGGDLDGALAAVDRAVGRYRELAAQDPASVESELASAVQIRDVVAVGCAEGLYRKAGDLRGERKQAEALAAYDDLLGRFGDDPSPALAEFVAMALFHKAHLLSEWRSAPEAPPGQ